MNKTNIFKLTAIASATAVLTACGGGGGGSGSSPVVTSQNSSCNITGTDCSGKITLPNGTSFTGTLTRSGNDVTVVTSGAQTVQPTSEDFSSLASYLQGYGIYNGSLTINGIKYLYINGQFAPNNSLLNPVGQVVTVDAGAVLNDAVQVNALNLNFGTNKITLGAPNYGSTSQAWSHNDVGTAFTNGWNGKNTSIKVIDNLVYSTKSSNGTTVNSTVVGGTATSIHGNWVKDFAQLTAPGSTVSQVNVFIGENVTVNNGVYSYGYSIDYNKVANEINNTASGTVNLSITTGSPFNYTINPNQNVLITKAAGNNSTNISDSDTLAKALKTNNAVLFVGALDKNGSTSAPATIASYSNKAGTDPLYQSKFLTVGVDKSVNGNLNGTSFAAPIVAGYASIINQKFQGLTGAQTATILLKTARTDTVVGDATVYGAGEASLDRALAPVRRLK